MKDWYPHLSTEPPLPEAGGEEPVGPRVRPVGRPLLALSSIAGDLAALQAVLEAVSEIELAGVVAAGDHCLGGPEPFAVWQRLMELKATLVRGETDVALGTLEAQRLPEGGAAVEVRHEGRARRVPLTRFAPTSEEEENRLQTFLACRDALGEIICRRLAELPSTAVVSLDGRAGVMITHGSPADEWRSLTPEMTETELIYEVGCTAEDALVVGRDPRGFVKEAGQVLVVGAGSVGRSPLYTRRGERTAHAVLIQEFTDGKVRARPLDVVVPSDARSGPAARRRAG